MTTFARALLAFACLATSFTVHAETPPLQVIEPGVGAVFSQITSDQKGDLCIAGRVRDAGGKERGKVIVVNAASGQLAWSRTADEGGSRFTACRTDGKFTYVGAVVDIVGPGTRQSIPFIYQYDGAGNLIAKRKVDSGKQRADLQDMQVEGGALSVVGSTEEQVGGCPKHALFLARLAPAQAATALSALDGGTYAGSPQVRLIGGKLQVSGNFLEAADKQCLRAPADSVAMIVSGKTQFRVVPQAGNDALMHTAFAANGDMVSLSEAGGKAVMTVVGMDGKLRNGRPVKSKLCQTWSLSASETTLYAVRSGCALTDEDRATLVAIDRASGVETRLAGIAGNPLFVHVEKDRLIVLSSRYAGKRHEGIFLQTRQLGANAVR